MKKLLSLILALVTLSSLFFTVNVSAASWPSLGAYSYCEITAPKKINVYTSVYFDTRGTSSPEKEYNAYIAKGDICKIYEIDSDYIRIEYPTSSGYKQGFIKRGDMFSMSSPSESFESNGRITTYKYAGSSSYGNTAKGDDIYKVGTNGNYTQIIYTAKSGSRAFKAGWVKNSQYNKIAQIDGPVFEQKPNNSRSTSIADIAETQIGYQGTKSNGKGKGDYTKYGVITNTNGKAWCASFVSWCANEANISKRIIPCTASCDTMKNKSSDYHKWTENSINEIKKNDIVFFAKGMQGKDSNHVGIVVSVKGNKITIIEGNTGKDIVKKNVYTVQNKTTKNGECFGYVGTWNNAKNYFCGYISVN